MKSSTIPAIVLAVIASTATLAGCDTCVESHTEMKWVTTNVFENGKTKVVTRYQPVVVCDKYEGDVK